MSKTLIYGLLTGCWAAIIFWLSTAPGEQLPKVEWLMTPDKFGHLGVYAILAALASLSLHHAGHPFEKWKTGVAMATALYGIVLEIVQYSFFPGRYFEFWDIVANIIGVFAGMLLVKKFIIHS
ncbi:MAG: hypothetical protein D6772_02950 [Bacteroidetes bacterium]|nr:MAG: hypothetical protein D6772_02950 [Bacteroidota bacterium]